MDISVSSVPPDGTAGGAAEAHPSRRSRRGLDLFAFFVADVQTGFGPFVSVYLTANAWSQAEIGLALTAHSLAGMICQMPGGALIDAVRSVRALAGLAVAGLSASALVIAAWPSLVAVNAALIAHAAVSCVIGPAIAAISLGLVGRARLGERLGRNARFLAAGNGLAAAAMGAVGYLFTSQAVFFFTAALGVPALFALWRIRSGEIDPQRSRGAAPEDEDSSEVVRTSPNPAAARRFGPSSNWLRSIAGNRPLLIFGACMALFQFANAAMLPIAASRMAMQSSEWASVFVGVGIVAPQFTVALLAPWVGRTAQRRGRRPMLLLGFGALVARGALFALVSNPVLLAMVQILDGVSAAVLGVLAPLIASDVTRNTGRFNLAQGVVGVCVGVGASFSTTLAGVLLDRFGVFAAFASLAGIAVLGFLLVAALMPETGADRRSAALSF